MRISDWSSDVCSSDLIGAAVVMPLAMGLLGVAFPPERRGWAIGIFSGLTGLAVLGGPMIGGAVTEGLAWQWIFWINGPVGALALPLVRSEEREVGKWGFGTGCSSGSVSI